RQPMVAPLRMRTRGLLERRGSSASLKLDLAAINNAVNMSSQLCESTSSETFDAGKHKRISRQQLRHMNICNSITNLFSEFAVLANPADLCRAKINGCALKNRHQIWPIRDTRVRIWDNNAASTANLEDAGIGPGDDEARSYINANYITGADSTPLYIAAEGPMLHTINDFWAMVWQEKSAAVVMVTNLEESLSCSPAVERKCEKYWPDVEARYGSLVATVDSFTVHEGIQIREISLRRGNEEHRLRHFWFKKWLDHRVPLGHTTKVLKLIAAVESCRNEQQKKHGTTGPVIVHCSAGIGRTCTFIAIALGVEQLLRSLDGVDVASIVSKLRAQRYGAVQRPEQYTYIYLALQRMERLLPEEGSENATGTFPAELCLSDDPHGDQSSDEENCSDGSKASFRFLNSGF
uniref:protein-tyrosine-phosphatase n=3 Tax=Parascaris univalens TaxID=6257 RepID=A0A915BZM4_PARUN